MRTNTYKTYRTKKPVQKEKKARKSKKKFYIAFMLLSFVLFIFIYNSSKKTVGDGKAPPAKSGTETSVMPLTEERSTFGEPSNNPPVISTAKLKLESENNMDSVKVIAEGQDKDGDAVTFKYEWEKNDESAGSGDSISGFKRGDKLSLKITPYDGKEYGSPKFFATEIKNSTPKIIENNKVDFDGKLLTYQVKAVDPDGDEITYALVESPKDMSIGKSNGIIKWDVPKDYSGKQPVRVKITDGHGGEVVYDLNLEAGTQQAKPVKK